MPGLLGGGELLQDVFIGRFQRHLYLLGVQRLPLGTLGGRGTHRQLHILRKARPLLFGEAVAGGSQEVEKGLLGRLL